MSNKQQMLTPNTIIKSQQQQQQRTRIQNVRNIEALTVTLISDLTGSN